MGLLGLKHDDIAALAPEVIIARGWAYYQEERVYARVYLNDRISARVVGSDRDYRTIVTENGNGLTFECDCPFDEPVCKHVIALLFNWVSRRYEFVDATPAVARLAHMSQDRVSRLLIELAGADWNLFHRAAGRVAGCDWAEANHGAEGILLGLAHRELSGPSIPFDCVDSLASRIEAGLSTLAPQMNAHDPAAVRALLCLADAGFSFWPAVDDIDGVLAATLEQAACELSKAAQWAGLPGEIAEELAGFLATISIRSTLPLMQGRSAALAGLGQLARRQILPPLGGLFGDDPGGKPAEDLFGALLEGWLQGSGSSDLCGLESLLREARRVLGDRLGWTRRLAALAGLFWRNRPAQLLLSKYADCHAGDGTGG